MARNTLYIYQDESGSLADPKSVVVVVALVATDDKDRLRFIVRKAQRRSLARRGKRYRGRGVREFKYTTASQRDRETVCVFLKNQKVDLFVIGVKTNERTIADSPQNYGLIVAEVFESLIRHYSDESPRYELHCDRHFTKTEQIEAFNQILYSVVDGRGVAVKHVDSKSDVCIAAADFVAGVFREEFVHQDTALSSLLHECIVYKEEIHFNDLKHKWISKIK